MLTLQGRTADFRVGDSRHRQSWVYVLSLEGDAGETTTLDDGSTLLLATVDERSTRSILQQRHLARFQLQGRNPLERLGD